MSFGEYYYDSADEYPNDSDMDIDSTDGVDETNDNDIEIDSNSEYDEEVEDEEELFSGNTNDSSSNNSFTHSIVTDAIENSETNSDSTNYQSSNEVNSDPPSSSFNSVPSTSNLVSESVPSTSSTVAVDSVSTNLDVHQTTGSKENFTTEKTGDRSNAEEEEAFSCPICLEGLTNSGGHRPACLKCGHIFGDVCLQRWIKTGCNSDARRCPTCNTKASLRDIRLLYAKKLVAIDTTELTALEVKLEKENREKNLMKTEVEKWKVKNDLLSNELEKLKKIIADSKSDQPCSSGPTSIRQCIKKVNLCKDAGCRVMAYNKHNMLLAVSQQSGTIFNGHGIRKLNASLLNPTRNFIHAHTKPIRDMAFHPLEHNLLATASLDKHMKLIDMLSETVVSSTEVPEPLWSCCWAGDNTNMLIAGSQFGSVFHIDRRYMKLVDANMIRKPGCVSLVPVPPSSSRSFTNGGFLKTRMDLLSVFEQDVNVSKYKETELPLKGLWSSTWYDAQSNLILSTAKPCGANRSVRHVVSKISDLNEGPVIHPVATFYGGDKATQLSRSCLVSSDRSNEDTLMCCYDEKLNAVQLFSINSCSNIKNFPVQEKFLDFCPLVNIIMHGRRTVAALSENAISIFTV